MSNQSNSRTIRTAAMYVASVKTAEDHIQTENDSTCQYLRSSHVSRPIRSIGNISTGVLQII